MSQYETLKTFKNGKVALIDNGRGSSMDTFTRTIWNKGKRDGRKNNLRGVYDEISMVR